MNRRRRITSGEFEECLTIVRNGEGFGSLFQSNMSGLAYCRYYGKKFVFTPAKSVGHNVSARQFNYFTGFSSDIISDRRYKIIKKELMHEVHFSPEPSKYYTEEVREELRKMYYKNPKPGNCPYDIAIHIRRGDVFTGKMRGRFITNKDYRSIILSMKEKYPDYSICVYSEGKIDDFSEFRDISNINFILNGDPLVSYHHLVTAKVLVTAISSYSYTAGILSKGKIYYINFKERPLNDWTILENYKPPETM